MLRSNLPAEERLYLALSGCYAHIHKMTERVLAPVGVTVSEYALLRVLENTPGITAAEAKERILATAPSVAQFVAQLESKKLIKRTPDANDARRLRLSLTQKGRVAVGEARKAITQNLRKLPVSGKQVEHTAASLSSLLTSLSLYGNK